MSETIFRMAKPDDAEKLCGLVRCELGYDNITVREVQQELEKMLSSDNYFTLVIEADNELCGYISSVREISIESGEYYRITGLAVKEEYQGQKLGTALITLIESKARAEGAALLTLSSQFKRTQAHEFYEKLGFEKTSYSFKKKLKE